MHTLILGFDSFDPHTFELLSSQGKLPALTRLAEAGKYARLEVSDPPQTEVSWTSIATGVNPGGHGIFDFVHRDPATYTPYVSLLRTQRKALGIQFTPATNARTIFEEAARQGYPATSLWWPATFPARYELPVRSIPGLGTPDIMGKLGVGTLYTTDSSIMGHGSKTAVRFLRKTGKGSYTSTLIGPTSMKSGKAQTMQVDLDLELIDDLNSRLVVGKQAVPLAFGKWSPIFEVSFKLGYFFTFRAITRAILTQVQPEIRLYLLPLQIHPLSSAWRYATPPSFIKWVWKTCGPFLSLGWPQDTTGLEEGCISDEQFLELCNEIFSNRECILMNLLDSFHEGILAIVFDSLDRIQHMYRRDRPDIVESWYMKLDGLVGRVQEYLGNFGRQQPNLLVLSDHGFTEFQQKVHLNRWLADNCYLKIKKPNGKGGLEDIDWQLSRAYAVGLNSLYINLVNREGEGSVTRDEYLPLVANLKEQLLNWRGNDDRPVAQRVLFRDEIFSGPFTDLGPDLLIGYAPGYRASSETGLGRWKEDCLEPNNDHWGADHCIDSQSVPGVCFSSHGFSGITRPSYRDIPLLSIGKELEQPNVEPPPPPPTSEEDKAIIEERLKSLGYL